MENSTFIYLLRDPRDGKPKYVGKSVNVEKRFRDHIAQIKHCSQYNVNLSRWLKSLISSGFKPILQILEICSGDSWKERERYWISEFKKQHKCLLNIDKGGRSKPSGLEGHPCPQWWREEMSRRHSGKKYSEEQIRKIRDSNLKSWANPELLKRHGEGRSEKVRLWWKLMTPQRREELSAIYRKRRRRGIGKLSPQERSALSSKAASMQWANKTADERRSYYRKIHSMVSVDAS